MVDGKVGDMGDAGERSESSLEPAENMLGTRVQGIPQEDDALLLEELLLLFCALRLIMDEVTD